MIPEKLFNGLKNLELINLENNSIERIHKNTFKSLNNLEQALLEVDEAVLSSITKSRKAKLILVNNFFRDQLDRFGEMDKTISLVQKGLNFESIKRFPFYKQENLVNNQS